MIPYIFGYFFTLYIALINKKKLNLFFSIILFTFLTLFIGLRYQIGPDWQVYVNHFGYAISNFYEREIGYALMQVFARNTGTGIYGLNLFEARRLLSRPQHHTEGPQ